MDIEKIRENLLNGTVQGYLTINNVEYVLVNKVHYSEALAELEQPSGEPVELPEPRSAALLTQIADQQQQIDQQNSEHSTLNAELKQQAGRIEELEELLENALPNIECLTQEQCNLITAIGQALKDREQKSISAQGQTELDIPTELWERDDVRNYIENLEAENETLKDKLEQALKG